MAIGGVYAGRMFDTLCGLGLGLTVATLKGESVQLFWGCCCCWTLNVLFFFSLVFLLVFFLDGAQRAWTTNIRLRCILIIWKRFLLWRCWCRWSVLALWCHCLVLNTLNRMRSHWVCCTFCFCCWGFLPRRTSLIGNGELEFGEGWVGQVFYLCYCIRVSILETERVPTVEEEEKKSSSKVLQVHMYYR